MSRAVNIAVALMAAAFGLASPAVLGAKPAYQVTLTTQCSANFPGYFTATQTAVTLWKGSDAVGYLNAGCDEQNPSVTQTVEITQKPDNWTYAVVIADPRGIEYPGTCTLSHATSYSPLTSYPEFFTLSCSGEPAMPGIYYRVNVFISASTK